MIIGGSQSQATGAKYEILLRRSIVDGAKIATLGKVASFNYTHVLNNVGQFSINLDGDFDTSLLAKDRIIDISRWAINSGQLRLDFRGLVTRIILADDANNNPINSIHGYHVNKLLTRRIVFYAAGTSQAKKNAEADDLIKEVVNENFGTAAASGRALPTANFTVAADTTDGPVIDKAFARKPVLRVLREVADASREKGTELYFGLEPSGDSLLTFVTRTDQWGVDRTTGSGRPLVFSKNRSNLIKAKLDRNWNRHVNGVSAGGQGQGDAREVVFIGDADGNVAELRAESFVDARSEETVAGVQTKDEAALTTSRPIQNFSGDLLSVFDSQYGTHWSIGDRVSADHAGLQFDCLIRAVSVDVSERGEKITARAEASL